MKLLAFAMVFILLGGTPAAAAIGKIAAQSGAPAEIDRKGKKIPGPLNAGIESMDVVNTRKGTGVNIDFVDSTKVKITENSRLVIDDFVFDTKRSDAGRLAMKVSMGTVRYASGQIAKANQQRVSIKTPTATIAVRGTDFFMTVDELGRSLVVLVPSCREDRFGPGDEDVLENCYVGKIRVSTDAGDRELDQPFEATYIASASELPGESVILALSTMDGRINPEGEINNNLIISPPAEIKAQTVARAETRKEDAEKEATENVRRSQAAKKEETVTAAPVKITTEVAEGSKGCHEKIRCVEFNPFVTFYREGEGNYAEVRFKGTDSNVSLTISHNGDNAQLPWGPAPTSGNVVVIRQSK